MPNTNSRTTGDSAIMRPTISIRPICAAGNVDRSSTGPFATHYTATATYLYIARQRGEDRFGPVPDMYLAKGDLQSTGRYHPTQRFPAELKEGAAIWQQADAAAAQGQPTEVSGTHVVASLPPQLTLPEWERLVHQFVHDQLVDLGMVVDWAIHHRSEQSGKPEIHPHVHLLVTARHYRSNPRKGQRQRAWLASAEQIRAVEDAWLKLTGLPPTMPVKARPTLAAIAA